MGIEPGAEYGDTKWCSKLKVEQKIQSDWLGAIGSVRYDKLEEDEWQGIYTSY